MPRCRVQPSLLTCSRFIQALAVGRERFEAKGATELAGPWHIAQAVFHQAAGHLSGHSEPSFSGIRAILKAFRCISELLNAGLRRGCGLLQPRDKGDALAACQALDGSSPEDRTWVLNVHFK